MCFKFFKILNLVLTSTYDYLYMHKMVLHEFNISIYSLQLIFVWKLLTNFNHTFLLNVFSNCTWLYVVVHMWTNWSVKGILNMVSLAPLPLTCFKKYITTHIKPIYFSVMLKSKEIPHCLTYQIHNGVQVTTSPSCFANWGWCTRDK
jgi:hypothetical protein